MIRRDAIATTTIAIRGTNFGMSCSAGFSPGGAPLAHPSALNCFSTDRPIL